jgi:hypothetical protein
VHNTVAQVPTMPTAMAAEPGTLSDAAASIDARMYRKVAAACESICTVFPVRIVLFAGGSIVRGR